MHPTKCPVCGTYYEAAAVYKLEECGGDGKCPARAAGERPSAAHTLCACNRKWLYDGRSSGEHGHDDCAYTPRP